MPARLTTPGLAVLIVAIASLAIGLWLGTRTVGPSPAPEQASPAAQAPVQHLLRYPEPRVIADFALVDQDGETFGLEGLTGRWSLLFFGFTYCPDICPATLAQLAMVKNSLREQLPEADLPQVVLVSVDPERDTPERLAGYVRHFDPDFLAVTGPHPQLRALTLQLGALYDIEEHEAGDNSYQVDHSAAILLMNPDGRLAGQFQAPHDVDAISSDLLSLLAAGEPGKP